MKRRNFIKTGIGAGAASMIFQPDLSSMLNIGNEHFSNISALNTKLGIKFVISDLIHSGAWEGSCRTGHLKDLTNEVDKARLDRRFDDFNKNIDKMRFFPELEIQEPVKSYMMAEGGDSEISYPYENLQKLAADDINTDIYVLVGGGLPRFPALKIAEKFRKPLIYLEPAGYGTAVTADLRNAGFEAYWVKDNDELKDLLNLLFVRKAFSNTRLLVVTNFLKYGEKGFDSLQSPLLKNIDILREKYGMKHHFIDYDEFFKVMDDQKGNKDSFSAAHDISKKLLDGAKSSNMSLESIMDSVRFYLAVQHFCEKYSCNAFTIDCFGLCTSKNPWNRRFTPCLTHALNKDAGYPSACEADICVLLAMTVQMYLSRKAIYMGNPEIDTLNNTLKIHHSVASLKMPGFDKPETEYDITAFTVSGFGATLRHDFKQNINKVMTVGRFKPSGKEMLITKGNIIDGNTIGTSCSQMVKLQIPNGREFVEKQKDYGHHLALVYGDYTRQILDLGKIMGFKVDAVL